MENIWLKAAKAGEEPKPLPRFGGENPTGTALGVNSRWFTVNGEPVVPVMGEFHFSRWPAAEWEEALEKMRAGGIGVVATYVFWIHHEEQRDVWDFTKSRNLRGFIEVCARLGFPLLLRIGPWAHGECRNGGFPDWLVQDKSMKPRTNQQAYLARVRRWYGELGRQAGGYMWKDGGPIVGVQLENEYGHCGGPRGEEGQAHMRLLKQLAIESGFTVPFYTATGWGGANVVEGETLPVLGAYPDAPWAGHTRRLPPNPNYLLMPMLNDDNIGSDLGDAMLEYTYDTAAYPYATAELGGGMQVTAHRRVVVSAADVEALALCKLGTGANLLGYYMYHGGTNPNGKLSTLQESKATGYPNDVPVKSYDFQAPIGESGELAASYRGLKGLHLFLHSFGHLLAPAACAYPENMVKDPGNSSALRVSARHNFEAGGGFVFVNNHVRHLAMAPHQSVEIDVDTPQGRFTLPKMHIPSGFYGIFAYNLPLPGGILRRSNAQLLCRIGRRLFLCSHGEAPFADLEGDLEAVFLNPQQARNAWRFGNRLYISAAALRRQAGEIVLCSCQSREDVLVYGERGEARRLELAFEQGGAGVTVSPMAGEGGEEKTFRLELGPLPAGIHEALLEINFVGDRAELYSPKGELLADWFATGLPWRVPLKRHGYGAEYVLRVYPSREDVYFDLPVKTGCGLEGAALVLYREAKLKED